MEQYWFTISMHSVNTPRFHGNPSCPNVCFILKRDMNCLHFESISVHHWLCGGVWVLQLFNFLCCVFFSLLVFVLCLVLNIACVYGFCVPFIIVHWGFSNVYCILHCFLSPCFLVLCILTL